VDTDATLHGLRHRRPEQKASDLSCVPLCADCHKMRPDSYHRMDGGRRAFERRYRVSYAREVKRLNAEWRELTRVA
jgi:hypothetical protein